MKLYVKPLYDLHYAGGRTLEGYIIVDHKDSDDWYAQFRSKALAVRTAKYLEKIIR